jgi:hypothetical protein
MPQFLLAAEADQIQDFVFRASHLREVVGGSQLLARFNRQVPAGLLNLDLKDPRLVVSDGGGFRILFDDAGAAQAFGAQLAQVYRAGLDGSLTVIDEPIRIDEAIEENFATANQQADQALRQAKRRRQVNVALVQSPWLAFCASCGISVARDHAKRAPIEERGQYLCYACQAKAIERRKYRVGEFLIPFLEQFGNPDKLEWPGNRGDTSDPTGEIADTRGYVAYLLADVNNMGAIVGKCSRAQMHRLSREMSRVLRAALAVPTRKLMQANFVRTLPLILGGDDVFALIPAKYALDFAREFCIAFEDEMKKALAHISLSVVPPTIGAALVICKQNYPFGLAHQLGEELLAQTKRLAKAEGRSAVNFQVVRGSQIGGEAESGKYHPTMRPYWIGADVAANGWQVDRLLTQRHALDGLPGKRQEELRALFDDYRDLHKNTERDEWVARLERLLIRIARDGEMGKAITRALHELGSTEKARGYWYSVDRVHDKDKWWGHGLPDLLDVWNYTHTLGQEA